jgi:hypothetical protein
MEKFTFANMGRKIVYAILFVLCGTIFILSLVISSKNRTIDTNEIEILRLKESKNQLSYTFEVMNLRRIRRDSLAEINSKKYDEQISALDHANDSIITATVRGLIAE